MLSRVLVLSVFLALFWAGPASAALPLPPSSATYILFNPGEPEGSGSAKIYIWYDASDTLYMRIEPVNGFDLLGAGPWFIDPGTQTLQSTQIQDENHFTPWDILYTPETFYLVSNSSYYSFPSVSQHTTLKFEGYNTAAYAYWPEDFTGQSYEGVCNCPAVGGGTKVVVVPLSDDGAARSEDETTPVIFLE